MNVLVIVLQVLFCFPVSSLHASYLRIGPFSLFLLMFFYVAWLFRACKRACRNLEKDTTYNGSILDKGEPKLGAAWSLHCFPLDEASHLDPCSFKPLRLL